MGGSLKQTGSIDVDLYSPRCGLAGEFCLKLRCEFNRDGH